MSDLYTWCQNNGEFGQQLLSEWVGLDENSNIIDIHKIGSGSTMFGDLPHFNKKYV